jgi:N-acetylglucosaminyldiphosphoundecaprenol N-acetyl-beta-D-mannosaminyltransferase
MIDRGKRNLLGVLVNIVDYEAIIEQIIARAHKRQPFTVSALAVHGIMTGVFDLHHRYRLNQLDAIVPDGQPVRWALNGLYSANMGDRVYGPTLMLKLCERAAQDALSIYLYGSRPDVLAALCHHLQARFPRLEIAGSHPSFFRRLSESEKAVIAQSIQDSGAAMVFVGLGCPRQEVWLYEYQQAIPIPKIAVGAAFDFHAGFLSQAPAQWQQWGLEWFYRLIQEPKRLWKRYVVYNSLYICLLLLQGLKLKIPSPQSAKIPTSDLGYG